MKTWTAKPRLIKPNVQLSSANPLESFYELNRYDHLVGFGGGWDASAVFSGVPELRANYLANSNLSSFVTDPATWWFTKNLIEKAWKKRGPVHWAYRCDTPRLRRRFALTISKKSQETLRLSHRLLSAEQFPFSVDFQAAPIDSIVMDRCSNCNHVYDGSSWIDPFDFGTTIKISARHTLCGPCESKLVRGLR